MIERRLVLLCRRVNINMDDTAVQSLTISIIKQHITI